MISEQLARLDKLDRTALTVLLASVMAIAAMLLVDRNRGVQVVSTHPIDGATVAVSSSISIDFGEPMRSASVEARFSVQPEISGRFAWRGSRLSFVPDRRLTPGVNYQVQLAGGAQAESGRQLARTHAWSFMVRAPQVAYLSRMADASELWLAQPQVTPTQVSYTGGHVFDFAVSPDGEQFVISVVNNRGGIDLWLINRDGTEQRILLDCGLDRCLAPDWSPSHSRIAFSREQASEGSGGRHGPPRLWTVEPDSGQAAAVYQNPQVLGYDASWSPDGGRLAFLDGGQGAIRILDLDTSGEQLLPTQTGLVGDWSPDGNRMAFNQLVASSDEMRTQLLVADLVSRTTAAIELSLGEPAEFGAPRWSPTGDWMVVGAQTASGGPGVQLWLMRPDGSQARPVVSDPRYTHGGYRWDPTGARLVFQRLQLGVPDSAPEVLAIEISVEGVPTEPELIAELASNPSWAP